MKKLNWLTAFFIAIGVFSFTSCDEDEEENLLGNWVFRFDSEVGRRGNAVSFVIGDFAYLGMGYDGEDDEYFNDLYQYDPSTNTTSPLANLPGSGRTAAVAFAIGDRGYVGLGFNDNDDELQDFYEYDPATNEWRRIADFAGGARKRAVAFSLDGKGYVGTGDDGDDVFKDFWEYDPMADSWTRIPSLGGSSRESAVAFVLGRFAYVGTGINNGRLVEDFWRFDPSRLPNSPWTQLIDLDEEDDQTITREGASVLTMGGLAYLVGGERGVVTRTVWEYDPEIDYWSEKTSLEGSARRNAVAFTVGNRGFFMTGNTGSVFFNDLWEFEPFEEEDEDD